MIDSKSLKWLFVSVGILFFGYQIFIKDSGVRKESLYFLKKGSVVVFGDSLTYGTGAPKGKRYPDHLSKLIREDVIVEGFPGITAVKARDKLEKVLAHDPKLVLITLGGNDLLRKVSSQKTLEALTYIFDALISKNIRVVFLGLSPPLGKRLFGKIEDICDEKKILYVPDILDGLWGKREFMADSIHPNEKGQKKVAERVFQEVKPYFSREF